MKPCISQATTLRSSFEADLAVFSRNGWTAVEIWMTKLESYLEAHSSAEAHELLDSSGIKPVAASSQGGLLLSRGAERAAHWELFRRRLAVLEELGIPTLVVTPDFLNPVDADDYRRAAAALGEAAAFAANSGVRIALEFQKTSPLCACIETALALVEQANAGDTGVCLDAFHYYTGPSKLEDLDRLSPQKLAWVQVCDLSATPRELAGDSDRILPGDGDFQLARLVEHLGRTGYDGYVSLEVLNPQLWQVDADRVADLGRQALCRVLGQWQTGSPADQGGP
jgi:sugar phosphate isomerase/epimerase